MSFLRPEAAATLMRWREALVGMATLGLGLWLSLTSFGAVFLIGLGLSAFGFGLGVTGVQRARFRGAAGAAGLVEIDERRVTYLGPFGGGAMDLDDVMSLAIHPHPAWLLTDRGGERLMIPVGAKGADALFDGFSALPGLSPHRLVTAVRMPPSETDVIWRRPPRPTD